MAADARREPAAWEPSTDTGFIRRAGPANRTTLSWQRTSASSALVGLFAGFTAFRLGELGVAVAAGAVALGALILGATNPRVSRHHPELRHPYGHIVRGAIVLALTGLVGAAVAVYALVEG